MDFTPKQFQEFQQIVYNESGINLHDGKKQLLKARLAKRLRKTKIESVEHYLTILKSNPEELINFVNAVTTNHTFFFRESHHFDCLNNGQEKIWCAASASGEEAYSIAIYCLEKGFKANILATDISTKVLSIGEAGIYPYERVSKIPLNILKKYFQKGHGKSSGYVRVKNKIKNMVLFKKFNLITDSIPSNDFDVIFCRNVMIYFDNNIKEHVINKLYNALKIGGFFVIGGAESLNSLQHKYNYIKPSVYRKL